MRNPSRRTAAALTSALTIATATAATAALVALSGCAGGAGSSGSPGTPWGGSADAMRVEVEVTSDAPTAASLRVKLDARADPQLVEKQQPALPYEQTFEVALDRPFPLDGTSIEAVAADGATWISCRITLDGTVVAEDRATGAGAAALCEKKLRLGPQ